MHSYTHVHTHIHKCTTYINVQHTCQAFFRGAVGKVKILVQISTCVCNLYQALCLFDCSAKTSHSMCTRLTYIHTYVCMYIDDTCHVCHTPAIALMYRGTWKVTTLGTSILVTIQRLVPSWRFLQSSYCTVHFMLYLCVNWSIVTIERLFGTNKTETCDTRLWINGSNTSSRFTWHY